MAPGSAVVDRVRRWLLLDGRRSFVTAVLLLVLYVFLGPVGHYLVAFGGTGLSEAHTLSPLFTTQLSGVFLLVSIVVSINSLFVSIPVIGLLSFVLMHLNELPAVHALVAAPTQSATRPSPRSRPTSSGCPPSLSGPVLPASSSSTAPGRGPRSTDRPNVQFRTGSA